MVEGDLQVKGTLSANLDTGLVGSAQIGDGTIAAADLDRSSIDDLYVNESGDGLYVNTPGPGLSVVQANAVSSAIEGVATSTANDQAGVIGRSGPPSWIEGIPGAGVLGDSNAGLGVAGVSLSNSGVLGRSGSGYGVHGVSANSHAVYAEGTLHATEDISTDGSAQAGAFQFKTPKWSYVSVAGDAFRPIVDDSTVGFVAGSASPGAYFTAGAGDTMVAPLSLPHGATIQSLKVSLYDAGSTTLYCYLYRIDLAAGTYATLAGVGSSGSSGLATYLDSTITSGAALVDNDKYAYCLRVWHCCSAWSSQSSNVRIVGARVAYTTSEAD